MMGKFFARLKGSSPATKEMEQQAAIARLSKHGDFKFLVEWLSERCYVSESSISESLEQTFANEYRRALFLELKEIYDNFDFSVGRVVDEEDQPQTNYLYEEDTDEYSELPSDFRVER